MDNSEKMILEKPLEVESKIAGLWREDGGDLWTFNKIEPKDRIGDLSVIRGVSELRYKYEVIWVDDDKVFFNKIWTSIPKKEQWEIKFFGNNLLHVSYGTHRLALNKA